MVPPPLIGITAGNDPKNEQLYILRWDYVRCVEAAGGLPVILAPGGTSKHPGLFDRIHGIIVSGGVDIQPERYGEEPHPALGRTSAERDAFELQLVADAVKKEIPVLGICRGNQVLNVSLGGTLVQDIPSQIGRTIIHNDLEQPRNTIAHSVRIEPGSRLASILPFEEMAVNSFHHQSVRKVAPGMVPVAWSPDGVIEAIERPGSRRLVLGIQWHPEAFWASPNPFTPLFETLVAEARMVAAAPPRPTADAILALAQE
jgi:putative glutamine amidotransferase